MAKLAFFSWCALSSLVSGRRGAFLFASSFSVLPNQQQQSGGTQQRASSSTSSMKASSTTTEEEEVLATSDPHKFLEDVLGEESLKWVEERNKECIDELGDPTEAEDYRRILGILDSKEKIPSVCQIGPDGMFYNFWQDDAHPQGIWRKTTLDSYKTGTPEWKTVLDLDALPPPANADTAATWVWHGSTLLDEGRASAWDRAFIALSPGGSDADTTREMDLKTEQFIDPADGGFEMLTPAKTTIGYRSRDEVLVGTDFGGDGSSMTDSGYPRVIKSWKRGTPITEAVTVFEAEQSDIAGGQYSYHDELDDGTEVVHEFRMRSVTFYTSRYEYRKLTPSQLKETTADKEATPFRPVPIQEDASIAAHGNDAMITLRSDWTLPGTETTYKSGSLLVVPMEDVMDNEWSSAKALFEPSPTRSLQGETSTKDYLILSILDDVRTTLEIWEKNNGDWVKIPFEGGGEGSSGGVPIGEGVGLANTNRDSSINNSVFLWRDGYLKPETVELVQDIGDWARGKETPEPLKALPAMFDAENLRVEQRFCASRDGTRIPYFLICRKDLELNGENPTIVDAYGGFEISMLPGYSATEGVAWLEKGGVLVNANIRGGGEYGPAWHQAALRENRYKCYEDMEAVARDLIDRKVTNPSKMACIGGSNGGLMVGNLITRPLSSKLYGAAVCQVPLLDMKVYSKLLAGASWMAEYGDPDKPDEWEYLRRHSPYHLLRHDNLGIPEDGGEEGAATNPDWKCPKTLFTTSTRDDRVHPGHARKMVRALLEEARPMGKTATSDDGVLYWENTEGGHGGAADNKQRAHMWALTYAFLSKTLGLE